VETVTVELSDEQLAKLVDAYKTLQDFLGSVLSPNEIYTEEFLAGLRESDDDLASNRVSDVRSFDDFTAWEASSAHEPVRPAI
jgi:hypothetical protein